VRLPHIDTRRCTGCGRCVAACNVHLLSLQAVQWQKFAALHNANRCTGCNACAAICPFHAITMQRPAT
jgi:ferredoxin